MSVPWVESEGGGDQQTSGHLLERCQDSISWSASVVETAATRRGHGGVCVLRGRPQLFCLDLVWIRLFRPVRAIAEPWDEGDGIEWAKMAVDRVTWQWLFGMPTPALCRGRLPSHWRPPLPGGGSRAATYPVADSHQARVNDGRTEERGTVIQRINRDLNCSVFSGGVRVISVRLVLHRDRF